MTTKRSTTTTTPKKQQQQKGQKVLITSFFTKSNKATPQPAEQDSNNKNSLTDTTTTTTTTPTTPSSCHHVASSSSDILVSERNKNESNANDDDDDNVNNDVNDDDDDDDFLDYDLLSGSKNKHVEKNPSPQLSDNNGSSSSTTTTAYTTTTTSYYLNERIDTDLIRKMKEMGEKRAQWDRNIKQNMESDAKIAKTMKELDDLKNITTISYEDVQRSYILNDDSAPITHDDRNDDDSGEDEDDDDNKHNEDGQNRSKKRKRVYSGNEGNDGIKIIRQMAKNLGIQGIQSLGNQMYTKQELRRMRETWIFIVDQRTFISRFGLFDSKSKSSIPLDNSSSSAATNRMMQMLYDRQRQRFLVYSNKTQLVSLPDKWSSLMSKYGIELCVETFVQNQRARKAQDGSLPNILWNSEQLLLEIDNSIAEIIVDLDNTFDDISDQLLSNLFLLVWRRRLHMMERSSNKGVFDLIRAIISYIDRMRIEKGKKYDTWCHILDQVKSFYFESTILSNIIKNSSELTSFCSIIQALIEETFFTDFKQLKVFTMTLSFDIVSRLLLSAEHRSLLDEYIKLMLRGVDTNTQFELSTPESELCVKVNQFLFQELLHILQYVFLDKRSERKYPLIDGEVDESYLEFKKRNIALLVHLCRFSGNYLTLLLLEQHTGIAKVVFRDTTAISELVDTTHSFLSRLSQDIQLQELTAHTSCFSLLVTRYQTIHTFNRPEQLTLDSWCFRNQV